MKSRIYGLLAAACLILTVTPAVRAEETVSYAVTGGNIYFDTETETVKSCDSSVTAANIPKMIKGFNVTSIGTYAFYWCSNLTSVSIPDSVSSIGDFVFCRCASLTSVSIPNSVTSIGKSAFNSCHSLTSVSIPNSVTSIGNSIFINCDSLTSVSIPNSVTSIGSHAFFGCGSLTSISIPNGVTSIGERAFSGTSLTDVHYDGTKAEYTANLRPNVDYGNDKFLKANFHFKDSPSLNPPSPNPNPALPNTAASDNTAFHGIVFLLLAALTLTVRALGRRFRRDKRSRNVDSGRVDMLK